MPFEHKQRQQWMATLARAPKQEIQALLENCQPLPEYRLPRPVESGLCMVRGRMGGSGAPFNLGEMTVTRAVVQLDDETTGVAYITGRDRKKAELAAIADALLLSGRLSPEQIDSIKAAQMAQHTKRNQAVASTKVDFFTLVRGEN